MNCGFDHHLHIAGIRGRRISADKRKDLHNGGDIDLWKACKLLILQLFTNAKNMLTWFIEGVKSTSFFDISKSFSSWWRVPGPKRKSLDGRRKSQTSGGRARVCSELLVEKNVKCSEAKIEAPRC